MKKVFVAFSILTSIALAEPTTQPSSAKSYGEPMKIADTQMIEVAKLLADPDAYAGKDVKVSGVVSDVCKNMGCWARLKPAGDEAKSGKNVFVKFTCGGGDGPDGKLLPESVVGKTMVVEGRLKVSEISEETARHYAEDGGASEEEIAKIKGPQKEIRIASPAARVE